VKVEDYRNEVTARLVKLDERQISIFKTLQRMDKHLSKLNDKVEKHGIDIERIKTYGSFAVLIIPIVVSVVLRLV
jgi:UDP-N-acetylglucosamine:LPS N-acetylglucosamine transferase